MVACGNSSSDTSDDGGDDGGNTPAVTGLRFDAAADFTSSAAASLSALLPRSGTTLTCEEFYGDDLPSEMDDPIEADGEDCDGDGGLAAHLTPTTYKLALKRVTLMPADEVSTPIDIIADTGTLGLSEVIDFTSADSTETLITIDPEDLTAGNYGHIEMELYYFEMTFPIANVSQVVRFYMSDDDFETEAANVVGLGGHHQGDVTFIAVDGVTELGWVDSTWLTENLSATRDVQVGVGGVDAETEHARGFFGNTDLWDAEEQMQGDSQDVFVYTLPLGSALEIPDPTTITDLTTITATFSTADTFFYEDFAPFNTTTDNPGFYPDLGGEAAGGEWAPLIPTAVLTVE